MKDAKHTNEMLDLSNKIAALDGVSAVVDHVNRYSEILASIPEQERTAEQLLWLLAQEGANARFKPGTEESLLHGVHAVTVLEAAIPKS